MPSRAVALMPSRAVALTSGLIGGAWLIAVLAQVTGHAGALHHHALIEEGGPPLWLAIPIFLVAWQVMTAGMMLPASLPAVRAFGIVARSQPRPGLAFAGFLVAYAAIWTLFGFAAFLGDVGLHHLVDATPWLQQRQWLIEAGVLALAGTYQFLPIKRRGLAACRHPEGEMAGVAVGVAADAGGRRGFVSGIRHGIDCLASSWALMLLMFAAGFANLAWMAALAAVMVYEAAGRHGQRVASLAGAGLLGLAVVVVLTGLALI